MRFEDPELLTLLILIPIIFFWSRNTKTPIRFSSLGNMKKLRSHGRSLRRFHPKWILLGLRALALTIIVCALARPQEGKKYSEILSEGVDILLALDTSGSMQALDFERNGERVTRLEIVKEVVSQFVQKRPQDRMGLVVFGEEAFTQCPLTLDHGILLDFLKRLEIGMAGDSTAIGSAIGVSASRMKDLKAKSKVVVLLTDGGNNAGKLTPDKAAEVAKTFGIKVYTVGVGTEGESPFLVDGPFGKQYVYQRVELDEKTLTQIATTTGGRYFRATDTEGLKKIYDEIDQLETTEIKVKEYSEYNESFHLYLIPALITLLLEMVLSQTRLRILP